MDNPGTKFSEFECSKWRGGGTLRYVRARNADPLCSFGDYVAVSDPVDDALAEVLRTAVSDGIVAPDFSPTALEVLKKKKSGGFVVIKADPTAPLPDLEVRTCGGVGLVQKRNDAVFTKEHCADVKTKTPLSPEATRDCIVASIAVKYTQSNSVGYAKNGMMLGVGAGQQSRVDCVKLAGRKTAKCYLMQHPKVGASLFHLSFALGAFRCMADHKLFFVCKWQTPPSSQRGEARNSLSVCHFFALLPRRDSDFGMAQVLNLPFKTEGVKKQERVNARVASCGAAIRI